MKVKHILQHKQPDVYSKLCKDGLTRFFEKVEKILDPMCDKLLNLK